MASSGLWLEEQEALTGGGHPEPDSWERSGLTSVYIHSLEKVVKDHKNFC